MLTMLSWTRSLQLVMSMVQATFRRLLALMSPNLPAQGAVSAEIIPETNFLSVPHVRRRLHRNEATFSCP